MTLLLSSGVGNSEVVLTDYFWGSVAIVGDSEQKPELVLPRVGVYFGPTLPIVGSLWEVEKFPKDSCEKI